MITLKELAQECGVSIATVSNILNGKSNVSKKTRDRILSVVKERGYKPNYMARGLRASSTKTIGLLVDDLGAFGTPEIIEGISSYCERNGFKVVVETLRIYTSRNGNVDIDSQEFSDMVDSALLEMTAMRVDGIIYITAYTRSVEYLPKNFKIPIVLAYAYTSDSQIPVVLPDDEAAAFELTEYLIKNGGKKIALIKGADLNEHTKHRENGFRRAMQKNGLTVDESIIAEGLWNEKSGYEACQKIFEKQRPDSIFCFNDAMAAGAYQFLYEKNIIPGKDISVVGFDNKDISRCLPPPLTTTAIPLYYIGTKSAELVLKKIEGEELTIVHHKVPCKLIERNSVCKFS